MSEPTADEPIAGEPLSGGPGSEAAAPSGRLRRVLLWASFAWLGVLAGAFGWAWLSGESTEEQVPRLVEAVEITLRRAVAEDPSMLDRLITVGRLGSIGEPDVLSELPEVRCAEAFRFSTVPDGGVVVGHRGTCLAEGVCVRSEIAPSGRVTSARSECSLT